MKKLARVGILLLILVAALPRQVWAAELLIPGGQVIGLVLGEDTLTVAAFDEELGQNAKDAGLQIGDQILSIDGRSVTSAQEIRQALNRAGTRVTVEVSRQDREMTLVLEPGITDQGPKLGVYLRRGVTGIGTVSWVNPETGEFGALGHGVNDGKGKILESSGGSAYEATVVSVKKGQAGKPGQLMGMVKNGLAIGGLEINTGAGVFGTLDRAWAGEPLPVAEMEEVRTGPATIRSTVSGDSVQEYSVEILKIYSKNKEDHRNLLLKVTDSRLLDATGGIVQGMSGSPILQNGRIVGAVTHVLVNDPTTGYGIFIENMLEAADAA